jgi:hypothetical protein
MVTPKFVIDGINIDKKTTIQEKKDKKRALKLFFYDLFELFI